MSTTLDHTYVYYVEPNTIGGTAYIKISVADAVQSAHASAKAKGYVYKNDAEALEDFMVVHWATRTPFPSYMNAIDE